MYILAETYFNKFKSRCKYFCIAFLLLSVLAIKPIYAQTDMLWYNGNYFWDFSSEPPIIDEVVLNVGNGSNSYSICNNKGEHLFCGKSYNVINRELNMMPNGFIQLPIGVNINLINGVIEAFPGIYYIINFRKENPNANYKLCYTKVDMSADSGRGDVDTNFKAKIAYSDFRNFETGIEVYMNEPYDNWVLCRTDSFLYAFRVLNGIFHPPVITKLNEIYANKNKFMMILKLSHDHKMLVTINRNYEDYLGSYIYVYDYDPLNGTVSNQRLIDSTASEGGKYFHSIAFSPNDSLIFSTSQAGFDRSPHISQYKRFASDIGASVFRVSSNVITGNPFGILKLGANSRIYMFPRASFGPSAEIIYPDSFAKFEVVYHSNRLKSIQFQYRTTHIFRRVAYKIYTDTCKNELKLHNFSHPDYIKFNWYVYQDSILVDSFNTEDARVGYSGTGAYYIKIKATDSIGFSAWYSDTIKYSDVYTKLNARFYADTNVGCMYLGYKLFDKSTASIINPRKGASWNWDFGDQTQSKKQNPEHIYYKSGQYNIQLVYSNGYCYDTFVQTKQVTILEAPKPGFAIEPETDCIPFTVNIKNKAEGDYSNIEYITSDMRFFDIEEPQIDITHTKWLTIIQSVHGPTGCITKDTQIVKPKRGFATEFIPIIQNVSVLSDQEIIINWSADSISSSFMIERKSSSASSNSASFAFNNDIISFIDDQVKTDENQYNYSLKCMDSCGNVSTKSKSHHNILLTGGNNDNQHSIINWSGYNGWENGVDYYRVDCLVQSDYIQIVNQKEYDTSYLDNDFIVDNELNKCYKVTAFEAGGNHTESVSNILCIDYIPKLFIPNAFSPNTDGVNDSFDIVGTAIKSYHIKIYNQWGEQIFDEENKAWDGTYKGKSVMDGVYIYRISSIDLNEQVHYYSGTITLIK